MSLDPNPMAIIFVPMRDGVTLESRLFLPARPGPFAAAYTRAVYSVEVLYERARSLCEAGYAVIVQYARGHGRSGGEMERSVPVAEDGYDTISWITFQNWSNGRVGTFGGSALAKNQINLAALMHPAHRAMCLRMPSWGIQDGLGGAWMYAQVMMWIARTQNGPYNLDMTRVDWQAQLNRLPVTSALDDVCRGQARAYYQRIITSDFSTWSPRTGLAAIPKLNIPALIVTSWWDLCQYGAVAYYQLLRKKGRDAQRRHTHLIIGPWDHLGQLSQLYDFGPAANFDLEALEEDFFEKHLQGVNAPDLPTVKVLVLGANKWRDLDDWPVPGARTLPLYLHPDRLLAPEKPSAGAAASIYHYDPAHPVPTNGGANNAPAIHDLPTMGAGPRNQYDLCQRRDVVAFCTRSMETPLTIMGPVALILYAASSAVDTDFTAKLMLVDKTGRDWMLLSDGIVRARYRHGRHKASWLTPGQVERYRIDLWHVAVALQPGQRLALAISSSNFPRFSRNLNTGGDNERDTHFQVAAQTLLHNISYPSYLEVPVVD